MFGQWVRLRRLGAGSLAVATMLTLPGPGASAESTASSSSMRVSATPTTTCTGQQFAGSAARLRVAVRPRPACRQAVRVGHAYRFTAQYRSPVRARVGSLVSTKGGWQRVGGDARLSRTRTWRTVAWTTPVLRTGGRLTIGASVSGRRRLVLRRVSIRDLGLRTQARPGPAASARPKGSGGGVAPAAPPVVTATRALPARIAAAYWTNWGKATPLDALPANINVVFASFAYGDGSGTGRAVFVPDDGSGVSKAEFKAQVKDAQAAGRRVILSIGGANPVGLRLLTTGDVTALVASINGIVDEYGFQGVDWDLEQPEIYTVDNLLAATRAWKLRYGSSFAVTASPAPASVPYKVFARRAGSLLDYIAPQYYGYADANRLAGIKYRTKELIDGYGVSPAKIGVGMKFGTDDLTETADVWRTALVAMREMYPGLAGASVWDATYQRANGDPFAQYVAPVALAP